MDRDADKRAAALAAADEVQDGMLVGLGTGSTAAFLIAELGRRRLRIEAVATSLKSESLAHAAGIAMRAMAEVESVDLAIDGVDEIDGQLRAIKGAGGAMLREKVVATSARRMVAIADGSKRVGRLGAAAVPVEVLPFAEAMVAAQVRAIGGNPVPRQGYRTDQDNVVLDCRFREIADPVKLAVLLSAIPGLLGHGLFLTEIDALYVANAGAVSRVERPGSSFGTG
jgi:ribose 5-phosphate isomerase A